MGSSSAGRGIEFLFGANVVSHAPAISAWMRHLRDLLLTLCVTALATQLFASNPVSRQNSVQESYPAPPTDLTRVYYQDSLGGLQPLPFETGMNLPNVFVPAAKDFITGIKLKGPTAATLLHDSDPRFYVFVGDKMDPAPHQLVRLAVRKGYRELFISLLEGRAGYAPFERDNLPLKRILLRRLQVPAGPGRLIYVNYMQIRPRAKLAAGEYAIIGDSLADMATFRIE